jgi:ABC-type dipeptide/oligopeptide/nickel transport system permease subunit
MRSVLRHRLAAVGLVIIVAIAGMAVFAPWLAPYDPNKQDLYQVLKGPSAKHWLGTDNVGRDLLSRVIYGSRVSMYVGLVATAFAAFIGILIGLIAGYRGGVIDNELMRITDTFMCFPFLVFVLVMAAALGPGINNIILSIALLGWTVSPGSYRDRSSWSGNCRSSRRPGRWAFPGPHHVRHVLPNSLAPVIVAASIHDRSGDHDGSQHRFSRIGG